jgi:hypothetical protein
MNEKQKTLRFGIMCNGLSFPAWQAQCLRAVISLGYVEPALIIINNRPPVPQSPLSKRIGRLLTRGVNLFSVYNRYSVARRCLATRPEDLNSTLGKVPHLKCEVVRKGKFSEYFKPDDIAIIRQHELDFILRFGFNIIRGEILASAKYGVWSFHHDDEQKYRGAPPSFWEIYHDDPQTGVVLQRLTERLDGGVILKRGTSPTILHSYPRNRDAAHWLGVDWPSRVCEDLMGKQAAYLDDPPSKSSAPIYLLPTNTEMIIFAAKQLLHGIQHAWRLACGRTAAEVRRNIA